jgi:hypothetical protein
VAGERIGASAASGADCRRIVDQVTTTSDTKTLGLRAGQQADNEADLADRHRDADGQGQVVVVRR